MKARRLEREYRYAKGFTLIELLVVIAIIALLMSIIMPALRKVKDSAKAVVCASQMKQFQTATLAYMSSNRDCLPYFGEQTNQNDKGPFWFERLAPYLSSSNELDSNASLYEREAYIAEIRRCPAARKNTMNAYQEYDCWIGTYFCSDAKSAPYYYRGYPGYERSAFRISSVRQSASDLLYLDTQHHLVYSPVESRYRFDQDRDGDGNFDSSSDRPEGEDYNGARPKVHSGGCNVGLMDGHVERVKFEDFWKVDETTRKVLHRYWYIK